jgi:poly(hydroxyalkanoate) depolymerase family esterase
MTKRAAGVLAGVLCSALVVGSARAGTVETSEASGRPVRVFVPSKVGPQKAAVLMLHGCTQTAVAFAEATRMDAVAEENGFYAIYIEQPEAIGSGRCFRWWDPKHQARGAGEPKELSDALMSVVTAKGIDPERVYVAGLSAGAAMSVVLGATYPDRFAAIGVVAGAPYKAATTFNETFTVGQSGSPDPAKLGDLAKAAMADVARAVPVLAFHGTADGVLASKNGSDVEAQWTRTNGLVLGEGALGAPTTLKGTAGGYGTTTITHRQASNDATVVELVLVDNLGHAWPGGLSGGSYADSRGPDASRALWAFFAPRTRSAALPAGPAAPPASSSASGGTEPAPAGQGTPEGAGAPASGTGSAAESGCAASPASRGAFGRAGAGALALALAALARMRRRRAA